MVQTVGGIEATDPRQKEGGPTGYGHGLVSNAPKGNLFGTGHGKPLDRRRQWARWTEGVLISLEAEQNPVRIS